MFNIDFESSNLTILSHPHYDIYKTRILRELEEYDLKNHFIIFSSGTTGGAIKGYALSKAAILVNAEAVNTFFNLNSSDIWGLSLPTYHVGGLSVLARAHLLKNKVLDLRNWEPSTWMQKIQNTTVTTIVPTQLFDLIKRQLKAPPHLKKVIVGGDHLSDHLKSEALKLGWPIFKTFGMTEVCSQLAATQSVDSNEMKILPLHQARIGIDDRLFIKSPALFTLKFTLEDKIKIETIAELTDEEGYFQTEDRATLTNSVITPLGRINSEIKISGHLINFNVLRDGLISILLKHNLVGQAELSVEDDSRKGKKLVLLHMAEVNNNVIKEIENALAPVRLDEIHHVLHFERTDLGKFKSAVKF